MPPAGTLPGRASLARRPRRRVRTLLRRQPVAFWLAVLATAAATWWATSATTARLADGADAYGSLVEVVVASRDVHAGAALGPDDVTLAVVPGGLVPDGALTVLPEDAVTRERLVAGEAVVSSRLAPQGLRGLAAALEPGERAVAIPLDGHRASIEVGHRIDLLATTDPSLTGPSGATRTVARAARVVEVDDSGITVAIPADEASALATALASAVVTVAIVGE